MFTDLFKNFSTSKLVFLLITITACAAFALGRLEAKDFMLLAGMAFSFYFSYKGDKPAVTTSTTDSAEVGAK